MFWGVGRDFIDQDRTARVSLKIKHATSIHPAIVLSGISLREMKTCVHIKTYTCISTAALLVIVPNWK